MSQRSHIAAVALACATLLAATAAAQPMVLADDAPPHRLTGTLGASVGFAKIAEDYYFRGALVGHLRVSDLTLSDNDALYGTPQTHDLRMTLFAPLHVLMADNDPQGADTIRRQDWDELGEQMRVLRALEYGTPYGGIYLRGGELTNVRVGHRSIVDNYLNNPDVDHFQWGVHSTYNTVYGGGDLLVDNVTDPELVGARGYVRPWQWVDPARPWQRVALGLSAFSDLQAPTALARNGDGTYALTEQGALDVTDAATTAVLGVDLEAQVVQNEVIAVTPFADFNLQTGQGYGIHGGLFLGYLPREDILVDARLEYRYRGDDYIPNYFGALYEIERYAYLPAPGAGQRLPKLEWIRGVDPAAAHGGVFELGVQLGQDIYAAGAWEDYEGPNNSSMWLRLDVPASETVELGMFYTRTNFDGLRGLFDVQDAFMIAESRIELSPWFSLVAQGSRRWRISSEGTYRPVDDFGVALGGAIAF